jgi:hypothetical protein
METAYEYLCVEVSREDKSWTSNLEIDGQRVRKTLVTEVMQSLADRGFELVTAAYADPFVPMAGAGKATVHVLWVRRLKGDGSPGDVQVHS